MTKMAAPVTLLKAQAHHDPLTAPAGTAAPHTVIRFVDRRPDKPPPSFATAAGSTGDAGRLDDDGYLFTSIESRT